MGKVVKLEPTDKAKVAAKKRRAALRAARGVGAALRRSAPPPASHKTALVLGGGGFTGGVYEIGALRALDLLAVNRTVNQFDVYVGHLSAGAFIAALTRQRRHARGDDAGRQRARCQAPFNDIELERPAAPEPLRVRAQGRGCCRGAPLGLAAPGLGQRGRRLADGRAARASPRGCRRALYTGSGIEQLHARRCSREPDRTDDFRELACELYLAATDLDTCERVVFGVEGWDDVPISTAVRASAALPMVYKPVRVNDRELIDGGIVSTTNLDIAVEAGAKLDRRRQPARALRERLHASTVPTLLRHAHAPRLGHGLPADRLPDVQAPRLPAAARAGQARGSERYPGVDIVLIEPEPTDELMFQTSIMNFASRVEIARHGFQSVTLQAGRTTTTTSREIAARHGIEISAHARAQGRRALRRRAREDARLAQDPRADRRARCCASPARGRARGAFADRGEQPASAPCGLDRMAMRTWSCSPSRVAVGDGPRRWPARAASCEPLQSGWRRATATLAWLACVEAALGAAPAVSRAALLADRRRGARRSAGRHVRSASSAPACTSLETPTGRARARAQQSSRPAPPDRVADSAARRAPRPCRSVRKTSSRGWSSSSASEASGRAGGRRTPRAPRRAAP